jgi:hypothetical protein
MQAPSPDPAETANLKVRGSCDLQTEVFDSNIGIVDELPSTGSTRDPRSWQTKAARGRAKDLPLGVTSATTLPSPSWTVPGKGIFDFHRPLGLWEFSILQATDILLLQCDS